MSDNADPNSPCSRNYRNFRLHVLTFFSMATCMITMKFITSKNVSHCFTFDLIVKFFKHFCENKFTNTLMLNYEKNVSAFKGRCRGEIHEQVARCFNVAKSAMNRF